MNIDPNKLNLLLSNNQNQPEQHQEKSSTDQKVESVTENIKKDSEHLTKKDKRDQASKKFQSNKKPFSRMPSPIPTVQPKNDEDRSEKMVYEENQLLKLTEELSPSIHQLSKPSEEKIQQTNQIIEMFKYKQVGWIKLFDVVNSNYKIGFLIEDPETKQKEKNNYDLYLLYTNGIKVGNIKLTVRKNDVLIDRIENFKPDLYKSIGTALCEFAYEMSLKKGFEGRVQLVCLTGTEDFYKRLGYQRVPDQNNPHAEEWVMELPNDLLNIKNKERAQSPSNWIELF